MLDGSLMLRRPWPAPRMGQLEGLPAEAEVETQEDEHTDGAQVGNTGQHPDRGGEAGHSECDGCLADAPSVMRRAEHGDAQCHERELVWVFQDGNLSGLLGFDPVGSIDLVMPILIFVFAFGLSMDYEVFLLARIKEIHDRTGDNDAAVSLGLQRTGKVITSAALLMVVVFGGFAAVEVLSIKQLGLGLALAVIVDATIVRSLMVPATMKLLGEHNWWAPAPLRRLHDRIGLSETDDRPRAHRRRTPTARGSGRRRSPGRRSRSRGGLSVDATPFDAGAADLSRALPRPPLTLIPGGVAHRDCFGHRCRPGRCRRSPPTSKGCTKSSPSPRARTGIAVGRRTGSRTPWQPTSASRSPERRSPSRSHPRVGTCQGG